MTKTKKNLYFELHLGIENYRWTLYFNVSGFKIARFDMQLKKCG